MVAFATPDGAMDVAIFSPAGPPKGGVIVYMDAFGLRPELAAMAARFADAGYLTYLLDLYHRLPQRHFAIPATAAAPLDPAMAAANTATTLAQGLADTALVLAHAAGRGLSRLGTVGYCMGARHALLAAATYPDAVMAAACVHGGRLVWDGADSPHRAIDRVRGALYFAFAEHDETCPEAHQLAIEQALTDWGGVGLAERYPAQHGWTFPTRWCHDRGSAELAHRRMLTLFDTAVAGGLASPSHSASGASSA
jgi:carboxymethylenebutenolidase